MSSTDLTVWLTNMTLEGCALILQSLHLLMQQLLGFLLILIVVRYGRQFLRWVSQEYHMVSQLWQQSKSWRMLGFVKSESGSNVVSPDLTASSPILPTASSVTSPTSSPTSSATPEIPLPEPVMAPVEIPVYPTPKKPTCPEPANEIPYPEVPELPLTSYIYRADGSLEADFLQPLKHEIDGLSFRPPGGRMRNEFSSSYQTQQPRSERAQGVQDLGMAFYVDQSPSAMETYLRQMAAETLPQMTPIPHLPIPNFSLDSPPTSLEQLKTTSLNSNPISVKP